jgi:hypothetical protein
MEHSEYLAYIESPEWKARSEAAKKRVGYRCQVCNNPGQLNAHHRTYERLGCEDDLDITVLCRHCHELYENDKKNIPNYPTTNQKKNKRKKRSGKPYHGKLGTSRMGDGIYTPRTSFGRAR